jgi:hypothetical protein
MTRSLKSWTAHYNRARPHSSLGPGITTRILRRPNFRSNGIAFLRTAALPRPQSWPVSITNTNWRRSQNEESGISYLRRTGSRSCARQKHDVSGRTAGSFHLCPRPLATPYRQSGFEARHRLADRLVALTGNLIESFLDLI